MLSRLKRLLRGDSAGCAEAAPVTQVDTEIDALLAAPVMALQEGRRDEALAMLETLTREHPRSADAHLLLGTLLHAQRRFEDAQDNYVLAACFRPDWWPPHLQQGLLALDQGRHADAAVSLARAVELGAQEAGVYHALGRAHMHAGDATAAIEQYRKALELAPDLAQAHNDLGYVLFSTLEEYEEGSRHIARAVELAPDDVSALCNWIMVLDRRADTEGALRLADELLLRDPQLVEARVNRALMLLKQGEFGRGWPEYEARKRLPGNTCTSDAPWPDWDGATLAGRHIFVHGEQGLGDEIMFASCVPDVAARAGACTLECHPKLVKIFTRSFENVQVLEKDTWRAMPSRIRGTPDVKAAIGSLPQFFRRTRTDFPMHAGYLRADPERVLHWKAKLAALPGRRKVGISWRGGLASSRRALRSIPPNAWLPVLHVAQADFVSLQYSPEAGELDALRQSSGVHLHHWQEAIDDYDETAALVCALDLVVSVQTAVVHLAGALGAPVWVLIPDAPEWRYGAHGTTMPWYPSATLVRQSGGTGWAADMESLSKDLSAWVCGGE